MLDCPHTALISCRQDPCLVIGNVLTMWTSHVKQSCEKSHPYFQYHKLSYTHLESSLNALERLSQYIKNYRSTFVRKGERNK